MNSRIFKTIGSIPSGIRFLKTIRHESTSRFRSRTVTRTNPSSSEESYTAMKPRVPMLGYLVFTVGFSAVAFGVLLDRRADTLAKQRPPQILMNIFNRPLPMLLEKEETLPEILADIRSVILQSWIGTNPAEKLTLSLVCINSLIFVAWRVPALSSFMMRNFMHLPSSRRYYTLLTCTFSHQDLWHFGLNMVALHSFLPSFIYSAKMSPEQGLAFYLSAGVVSSFGSHLYSYALPSRALTYSLGASGAIYALLFGVAYYKPETRVRVIILPFADFTISDACRFMFALDFVGLVLGWRRFDHGT
jgi:rhomboid-like protein